MYEPHQMHDHDHDDDGSCLPHSMEGPLSEFDRQGIRFRYPADWTLSEQSNDEETTISLQSEGTSFWTLMLFKDRLDPEYVLETVVAAFEQDYEDVDVVATIDNLSGFPTLGRDLDFVCYDLVNSAIVRAFQTSDQTIMVLYQGTDHELKTTREQLLAITASLQFDDETAEMIDDEE